MGIFSAILDKLRGHGRQSQPQSQPGQTPAQQQQYQPTQQPDQAIQPLSNVDVEKVLKEMAAKKGGGGNYRESIVDLLKLLDIDSSLAARKELATELHCPPELMEDSAKMNVWLHKTVLARIAENGGNVPKDLLD